MTGIIIERGTVYYGNTIAYTRIEARQISYEIRRSAQYDQAIWLYFMRKGGRKSLRMDIVSGKLVVLSGWGHPAPPETWDKGTPMKPISTEWGEVNSTVHNTRYAMGDNHWHSEFDAFLEDYIQRSGAKIILDFREHDFKNVHGEPFKISDLTPEMPVVVTGVVDGQIVPAVRWPDGKIPSQEFANLADAQKVFPGLNLKDSKDGFLGPVVDKRQNRIWTRFDSREVFELLSQ